MLDTYVAKTGLPESEIKAMMDAETWLTAEEAKEKDSLMKSIRQRDRH